MKLLLFPLVTIIVFALNTLSEHTTIYAIKPIVQVSPECGKLSDHRVNFTVNGFNRDGNVYWEFINSTGFVDPYGYFATNNTGGFDDYVIADDIYPDDYVISFFDDKNNDFMKDDNGVEVNVTYSIPCKSPLLDKFH